MASLYGAYTLGMGMADHYYKPHKSLFKAGRGRGQGTAKRSIVEDGATATLLSTRTLYVDPLVQVGETTTNQIDRRQRDIIYVPGAKICYEFVQSDTTTTAANGYMMNFAIVRRS